MKYKLISLLLFSASLFGCATNEQQNKEVEEYVKTLNSTQASLLTERNDDSFSNLITYNTKKIFKEPKSLLDNYDVYMFSTLNKKNKKETYDIIFSNVYVSKEWRNYSYVSIKFGGEIYQIKLEKLKKEVASCSVNSGCVFHESYSIPIDNNIISKLKTYYLDSKERNNRKKLLFKIYNDYGGQEYFILSDEIYGLFIAMEKDKN